MITDPYNLSATKALNSAYDIEKQPAKEGGDLFKKYRLSQVR